MYSEVKAADEWMLQCDVRELLERSPTDANGYLTVYEKAESHVERRFTILNPLARRNCLNAIKRDHSFNEEICGARFPVVRPTQGYSREMQISPRFWKDVRQHGLNAALADDGSTLFEWQPSAAGTIKLLRMKEDILCDDLRRHRLCGVSCIESMRFSEKSLAELGLSDTRVVHRAPDFIYRLFIGHRPGFRFRMQTASIVMGKRIMLA